VYLAALFGLVVAVSLPASAVDGTLYKCTDPSGVTAFRLVPCSGESAAMSESESSAASDAEKIADREAISKIGADCVWRAWHINARADTAIRGTETTRLRSEAAASANSEAVLPPDGDLAGQLAAAEGKKTSTLSGQRTDLKHLRKECDKERAAERKRQADRDAARVEAKP
jgi:hypothetical protein